MQPTLYPKPSNKYEIKAIVYPKLNIWGILTHPEAIQDADEFIYSTEQHYITCSSMDPLQWMGAVRMRIQTADKTSR